MGEHNQNNIDKKSCYVGSNGGHNQNNIDKNPAKGGVWVDITKTIVIKTSCYTFHIHFRFEIRDLTANNLSVRL